MISGNSKSEMKKKRKIFLCRLVPEHPGKRRPAPEHATGSAAVSVCRRLPEEGRRTGRISGRMLTSRCTGGRFPSGNGESHGDANSFSADPPSGTVPPQTTPPSRSMKSNGRTRKRAKMRNSKRSIPRHRIPNSFWKFPQPRPQR